MSNGDDAPVWMTANRYGLAGNEPDFAFVRAGVEWNRVLPKHWRIDAGLDLAGGKNLPSRFWIQQAYADVSWKVLTLSVGSKERTGFPLEKNTKLTSGWMVEGTNMRPVPQVRVEVKDYLNMPGTKGWMAFKGHVSYGYFTDSGWQKNFVAPGQIYTMDVSLMIKLGNHCGSLNLGLNYYVDDWKFRAYLDHCSGGDAAAFWHRQSGGNGVQRGTV